MRAVRRLNRTTLLMAGCTAFLLGVVAARKLSPIAGWWALVGVVLAVLALRKRTRAAILVVIAAGLLIGVCRGGAYKQALQPYTDMMRTKVVFTATASIDAVYAKQGQLTFVARDIAFISPQQVHAPGFVKVSGFGVPMVYKGDKVEVRGKLYPTRGSNQATISFATITKIQSGGSAIDTLRRKFAAGMQTALPEPLASFGMGLLVGQRNTLPEQVSEALLMVGLTHIIAVSGYNLTILLEASKRVLGDKSKVLYTAGALALIGGFLLIAGTSASIVRAAVISILSLSAWYYGRTVRPVLLILLAAAGTVYANPVYVWADIGWYLSFLAFFGVVVLSPMVIRAVYRGKEPRIVPQMLLETVCAEVMTLPLVLYLFGQMSLVSLLANLLVAAFIPLAMLLSLFAGLAGMCVGVVSGWFAWPAQLLLTYMLDVVTMLSRIPHVFLQERYLSVVDMSVCYGAVILTVVLVYWRRQRKAKFGYAENETKL